jgi:hypothetical protein
VAAQQLGPFGGKFYKEIESMKRQTMEERLSEAFNTAPLKSPVKRTSKVCVKAEESSKQAKPFSSFSKADAELAKKLEKGLCNRF